MTSVMQSRIWSGLQNKGVDLVLMGDKGRKWMTPSETKEMRDVS